MKDSNGNMKDSHGDIAALQPHEKVSLSSTFRYRGLALHQQGELERAIEDLNTTIRLRPDYSRPYRDRGRIYRCKGDYNQAIADFNKVMDMSTHVATLGRAHYGRGRVYLDKDELGQAKKDLDESIGFDSLPGHTFFYRGIVLLRLEEWENARADLVTACGKKEDIVARFQREFGSVRGFERAVGVQLPEHITALLMAAADANQDTAETVQTDVTLQGSTRTAQGTAQGTAAR